MVPEPILHWNTGAYSRDGLEGEVGDLELNPKLKGKRPIQDPILNWISGYRHRDSFRFYNAAPIDPLSIENPVPSWLPERRDGIQPELAWKTDYEGDYGALLERAGIAITRRRRTQPAVAKTPEEGLVRRYIPEKDRAAALVRKVQSKTQYLDSALLSEPSITIGEAKPWGRAGRVPHHRLEFNPFESEEEKVDREAAEKQAKIEENIASLWKDSPQSWSRSVIRRYLLSKKKSARKSLIRRILEHPGQASLPRSRGLSRKVRSNTRNASELRAKGIIFQDRENAVRLCASTDQVENMTESTNITALIQESEQRPDLGGSGFSPDEPSREESIAKKVQSTAGETSMSKQKPEQKPKLESSAVSPNKPAVKESIITRAQPKARKVTKWTQKSEQKLELESNNPSLGEPVQDESISKAVPNDTNIEITHGSEQKPELKRTKPSPPWKTGTEGQPPKRQRVDNKRKAKKKPIEPGSSEEILDVDIKGLLSRINLSSENVPIGASNSDLPTPYSTIELNVSDLSSTGEGLAIHNNHVYIVPFALAGEKVEAKVRYHNDTHSMTELIKVITPSPDRDESLVSCKYFGTCSGCQFQMLPYDKQLEHKRKVVQKAFANFSNLAPELLPEVGETMGSPMQYGYRTKLTPHFNGPRKGGFKPGFPTPNIGFNSKDARTVIDIEDCPIGTDTLREAMKTQRQWVKDNLHTYKRGATLLLRESTIRTPIKPEDGAMEVNGGKKYVETKECITVPKQTSVEYVGDFKFESPAGAFFQNNNSILVKVCRHLQSFTKLRANPHYSSRTTSAKTSTSPSPKMQAILQPLSRLPDQNT